MALLRASLVLAGLELPGDEQIGGNAGFEGAIVTGKIRPARITTASTRRV